MVAINSFGFGGANAHIILESQRAPVPRSTSASGPPRLVLTSGRHEQAVRHLLSLAAAHKDNADLHALMDAIHRHNIVGHPCRGFTVLSDPPVEECFVSFLTDELLFRLNRNRSSSNFHFEINFIGNGKWRAASYLVRLLRYGVSMAGHGEKAHETTGVRG